MFSFGKEGGGHHGVVVVFFNPPFIEVEVSNLKHCMQSISNSTMFRTFFMYIFIVELERFYDIHILD